MASHQCYECTIAFDCTDPCICETGILTNPDTGETTLVYFCSPECEQQCFGTDGDDDDAEDGDEF
jgi:hypothetical protein